MVFLSLKWAGNGDVDIVNCLHGVMSRQKIADTKNEIEMNWHQNWHHTIKKHL